MTELPRSLSRLLSLPADDGSADADAAWRAFVADHTRLLLYVARSVLPKHDDTMDAYAFVLEQLRAANFRRLREFAAEPRSKLSTWLVVVARRLCLDFYRQRYGRNRDSESHVQWHSHSQRSVRRRLQDLLTVGLEWNDLPLPVNDSAELAVQQEELSAALEQALGALAPQDRLLVRLRFDDDLTAQEIARIIGLPSPFHVYRRVNALLAELRRSLERVGIESSVP